MRRTQIFVSSNRHPSVSGIAAATVMPDIPENALVERLHLSTTRDKDSAVPIPSVGASGGADKE